MMTIVRALPNTLRRHLFVSEFPSVIGATLVGIVFLVGLVGASPAMAEFGLQKVAISARNQDGTPDVQAGSHIYSLNTTILPDVEQGDVKDVRVELPPGFVGDPDATARCPYQDFIKEEEHGEDCSNDSAIGVATSYVGLLEAPEEGAPVTNRVFNLVPPKGVAAEFGFIAAGVTPVLLATSLRTGTDYGLTTTASNVNQAAIILASKVTIWGVPANPAHNPIRGACETFDRSTARPLEAAGGGLRLEEAELETPFHRESEPGYNPELDPGLPEAAEVPGGCPDTEPEIPLLTNPSSCGEPRTATVSADSWEEPNDFSGERTKTVSMPQIIGCESLAFSPTIALNPERRTASTPSGLEANIRLPQEGTQNPAGLAEADVEDTTVTLPIGVTVNPSSADGLQACSTAQIGYTGQKELEPMTEPGVTTPQFTSYLPGSTAAKEAVAEGTAPASEGTLQPGVNFCPEASKIANVHIKSPLLEEELVGSVYLAAPQNFKGIPENPFETLLALYMVAEAPQTGLLVKLPGKVTLDEATGQITTSFDQTPDLPFSDLSLQFFGGERAPLATPALCGTYQAQASLIPSSGGPAAQLKPAMSVTSGPGGSACPGSPLPFTPTLAAGTTSVTAGAFSSLVTSINREDGQQSLRNVSITFPPGVSGVLTGVPLCPEAQANVGTCGAASEIGEATASAGVGNDPYTVTGGRVYLTEHYDGAPFGLSIVTPAVAGPFNLGDVIVRAKVEVNRLTGAITVATGEIPHILDGIPLQIKHVKVTVNRPSFSINPTSCAPMSVTATIGGEEGANSPLSSPFQVGDCAGLKFQPKVQISTKAHASKRDGASLTFKISYPKGALGAQSWFNEAKFVIPQQLPAELKTIQQACLASTFESDRGACPAHSIIGHAIVHTPLLPEPLTGPVYFVSFGSAKFPDAVMVLSGYGVTIELRGETYIHKGITSATFRNTPDVPFESIEVNLPEGEYSEFGANLGLGKYDFCGHNLKVPTEFKAQNGLVISQQTQTTITGCPAKHHKRHKAKKRRR